jgi:hypothetical protein
VPRAKQQDLDAFVTTSLAATQLGLTPYLIKARIRDGVLPPASRISDTGVMLFDADWMEMARAALGSEPGRKRRPRTAAPVPVPTPEDVLDHRPGEAGWLPEWGDIVRYFNALAEASDRVTTEVLGTSTDGRPYLVVNVSAPENLGADARQRNRDLLRALWDPRGTTPQMRAEAIESARTVGVVLAAQHSNEIGSMLMSMQLASELASGSDPETLDLLQNTVAVFVPSHNPDGIDMIVDWYRRWVGTEHDGVEMPWLYHPYVGHDNNRDWFMMTQAETRLYVSMHNREHPQAVFDMHQMGRFGPRYMVPPFIDPLDPNQDPLIQQGFSALGTHIAQRLTAAGKSGVVINAIFDNYSPSLAYGNYHGSVDLLSEAASCKLATSVTLTERDLNADYGVDPTRRMWNQPWPWEPGEWSLADVVVYNTIAARAFLGHLSRNRRQWLSDYASLQQRVVARDDAPRAWIFPPDQRDPRATYELLDILDRGLVEVQRATAPFEADGIEFPAGSHLVRLDQPAAPFAKTLLEVQEYPDLRHEKDGPLREPYDISGHTLPIQMGVDSIEIERPLGDALPVEAVDTGFRYTGRVVPGDVAANAWVIDGRSNAVIEAINSLMTEGVPVGRLRERRREDGVHTGDAVVLASSVEPGLLERVAESTGADIRGVSLDEGTPVWRQSPVRIAVFQPWSASIDEGWARWVLADYRYGYTTVHVADVRQGNLRERFDVLLVPQMSVREFSHGRSTRSREGDPYPLEYLGGLGEAGNRSLREFVGSGGTLIAIDHATSAVIEALSLPVETPLRDVPSSDFSCPGSLLRVVVDTTHPLGYGLPRESAVLFMRSTVFAGSDRDVSVVARYPQVNPLLSGWIHGPQHIQGKSALTDVAYGDGQVVLVGFRPYFRAQSRGTYRLLFNAINRAGYEESTVGALIPGGDSA